MGAGIERQLGVRSMFSIDYVRELGTQLPLGIDSNHVGDAAYLTDGQSPNPVLNSYAAELAAISATTTAVGCPAATSAGGSSQTAVQCYISTVSGPSIVAFARNGLDSSNAYCARFPCSVLGKGQASFGGINPAVGSNIMYFPSGRSQYQGIHFIYHTSSGLMPSRRVRRVDLSLSYTLSRYRTNIAAPDGSGGDYSALTVAQDFNRPHLNHFGSSGLDRTHQIALHSDLRVAPWAAAFPHHVPRFPAPAERLYSASGWRRSGREKFSAVISPATEPWATSSPTPISAAPEKYANKNWTG